MNLACLTFLPYCHRIHKYASCSNECFILALIYIDRLIQRNNFLLTELNVHRVVITAILLAAKFFDDAYYNNAYYSKVGGVLVSEMNGLEVDFLFRINFSLHVTPELFYQYKEELVAHSVNAGMLIPQPPQPEFAMMAENDVSPTHAAMNLCPPPCSQEQTVQPAPMQMQDPTTHLHVPYQVTPSPSATAAIDFSAQVDSGYHHHLGTQVPSLEDSNAQAMFVRDHLLQNGFTQQFLQRANSLPVVTSGAPYFASNGRCAHNPPFSAPMVSMLPVDSDQYLVMDNTIFPIQTTLVHHHHGVDNFHTQSSFHNPVPHGGYTMGRDTVSSLVAGHY
jgi:Cyclin